MNLNNRELLAISRVCAPRFRRYHRIATWVQIATLAVGFGLPLYLLLSDSFDLAFFYLSLWLITQASLSMENNGLKELIRKMALESGIDKSIPESLIATDQKRKALFMMAFVTVTALILILVLKP